MRLMLPFHVFVTLHHRSASPPRLRVLSGLCVGMAPSLYLGCRTSPKTSVKNDKNRFFQISALRTLSFSVSRKSFVCHSYENCRVYANNSQSGTRHSILITRHCIQVLSFHILPHSFAHFCTHEKLNSFIFNQFRTLWQKHPGWGGCTNDRE